MTKLTKTILARTVWLAKGAALFWGSVLTLAVVLGVGTTALAAVPGDSFRLGRINAVDAASGLVGSVNGATLAIENKSPGSKGAPAPALSLKVTAGNPPLVANPEAGTAKNFSADELDGLDQDAFLRANGKATDANLLDGKDSTGFLTTAGKAADSDRLDGKDSTSFANGTNGKANDADRLDGLNSSSFWTGERYGLLGSPKTGTPFAETFSEAGPCDPGDTAIYGGYRFLDSNGDHEIVRETLFSNSFMVSWSNGQVAETVEANVVCADFPPLR
jgi:hypothetical protein